MKNLNIIFREYLESRGEIAHLGPKEKDMKQVNISLSNMLDKRIQFNDKLIIVTIILIIITFVFGIFVVLFNLNKPNVYSLIFGQGGVFSSFIVLINLLKKIWKDKLIIDICIPIIRESSPEDATKIIKSIYFNNLSVSNYKNK